MSVLEKMLLAVLALGTAVLPFPYGAVQTIHWAAWGLMVMIVVALIGLHDLLIGGTRTFAAIIRAHAGELALLAAAVFYVFMQVLPLAWGDGSWPGNLLGIPQGTTRLSLAGDATLNDGFRLVLYISLYLALLRLMDGAHGIRLLAAMLIVAAVLQTLIGFVDLYYELDILPEGAKDGHFDRMSGTFINRNHYANMMGMTIPLAIGFLMSVRPSGDGRRLMIQILDELLTGRTLFWLMVVAIMFGGLFYSGSRGGALALLGGLGVVLLMATMAPRKRRRPKHNLALGILSLGAVVVGGEMVGWGVLLDRLMVSVATSDERVLQWQHTLYMIKDHLWLGSGFGSYQYVFPQYKPAALGGHLYEHAHNDYLEALATLGIGGVTLLYGAIAYILWRNIRAVFVSHHRSRRIGRGLIIGINAGTIAFLVHGVVDFSFYITANTAYFFALMAMGTVAARQYHVN